MTIFWYCISEKVTLSFFINVSMRLMLVDRELNKHYNKYLCKSFNSGEHINENRDGPYRGFGYSSLTSVPKELPTWSQKELQ